MSELKDLILDVYHGRISIDELTDEEYDAVVEGFKQVAEELVKMSETSQAGQLILDAIATAEADPFEQEIQAAELRGSTYWEIEVDYIH